MQCPQCGAENRSDSNFCRYCSAPLSGPNTGANSGYIPSVPPPNATEQGYRPPVTYQPPPPQPARRSVVPPLICPRCNAPSVLKGTTPLWAILIAVIGAPFTCFLSLLFLLVKESNRCLACGITYK